MYIENNISIRYRLNPFTLISLDFFAIKMILRIYNIFRFWKRCELQDWKEKICYFYMHNIWYFLMGTYAIFKLKKTAKNSESVANKKKKRKFSDKKWALCVYLSIASSRRGGKSSRHSLSRGSRYTEPRAGSERVSRTGPRCRKRLRRCPSRPWWTSQYVTTGTPVLSSTDSLSSYIHSLTLCGQLS